TKSLYQRCVDLIATLYSFPLFEFYLFPNGVNAHLANSNDTFYIADPVEVLWNCFKLGVPLCVIYNKLAAVTSGVYLELSDVSNVRPPFFPTSPCKDSYDKFINACNKDMNIQSVEVFDKSELYKDDTAGFMKVLKLVGEIIILIERNNGLPAPKPLPFSTEVRKEMATSPHLIKITRLLKELVETENAYIYALEELQKYEAELAASKVFSKDMIKSLFSNLNELVDFQRRFAIGLESTIRLGFDYQKIGELFMVNEKAFEVYFPFCSNFQSSQNFVATQTEKLQNFNHIIPANQLQLYFIKPIQRLLNYPLILRELVQITDLDNHLKTLELEKGLGSIKRVVGHLNVLQRKRENERIFSELVESMEDWKGLRPSDFGELLLVDQVLLASNDQEQLYELFLFEKLLLCCKKNKKAVRGKRQQSGTFGYIFRGHIHVSSMLSVVNSSDPIIGDYSVMVYWKEASEPDLVRFGIKFRNGEQASLWADQMQQQMDQYRKQKQL
ncbi:hypothetical protein HDU79_000643, partial [Rhizoclosmatium sp. JEL0117]